jgi:hypothetical protein
MVTVMLSAEKFSNFSKIIFSQFEKPEKDDTVCLQYGLLNGKSYVGQKGTVMCWNMIGTLDMIETFEYVKNNRFPVPAKNPYPERLIVRFEDGFTGFLPKNTVKLVSPLGQTLHQMMKWFLLFLLTPVYLLAPVIDRLTQPVAGDKVCVISAPLYGGALLDQLGTIVSWDSDFKNPFPKCLIRFADGYSCFLYQDKVKLVDRVGNPSHQIMKWILLVLLSPMYLLSSTLDLFAQPAVAKKVRMISTHLYDEALLGRLGKIVSRDSKSV